MLQPNQLLCVACDTPLITHTGLRMDPRPFTPLLLELKQAVDQLSGEEFDTVSVLCSCKGLVALAPPYQE